MRDSQNCDRVFYFGRHASLQKFQLDVSGKQPHLSAFQVTDELDDQVIAASRMASVAITAPQVSGVNLGCNVVAFWLDMVGNLAAHLYQLIGVQVIGLDTIEARCQLANKVGSNEVLHVPYEKQLETVIALTPQKEGAQICVDAVGHCAVIQTCVHCT